MICGEKFNKTKVLHNQNKNFDKTYIFSNFNFIKKISQKNLKKDRHSFYIT